MLVFALDLENIEKVGRGGVHLDCVLGVFILEVGQVDDLELLGALTQSNSGWSQQMHHCQVREFLAPHRCCLVVGKFSP